MSVITPSNFLLFCIISGIFVKKQLQLIQEKSSYNFMVMSRPEVLVELNPTNGKGNKKETENCISS